MIKSGTDNFITGNGDILEFNRPSHSSEGSECHRVTLVPYPTTS